MLKVKRQQIRWMKTMQFIRYVEFFDIDSNRWDRAITTHLPSIIIHVVCFYFLLLILLLLLFLLSIRWWLRERMPKTMFILFLKRCLNHFYLRPNIKLQPDSHAHVNCESSIGVKQNKFEKKKMQLNGKQTQEAATDFFLFHLKEMRFKIHRNTWHAWILS